MKTAVSLPDELFREADQAAKRLKVTRSDLYRRALEAYLGSLRGKDVTASYNAAFGDAESRADRRVRQRSVRRVLRSVEWKE
jgi:hypothetical protein